MSSTRLELNWLKPERLPGPWRPVIVARLEADLTSITSGLNPISPDINNVRSDHVKPNIEISDQIQSDLTPMTSDQIGSDLTPVVSDSIQSDLMSVTSDRIASDPTSTMFGLIESDPHCCCIALQCNINDSRSGWIGSGIDDVGSDSDGIRPPRRSRRSVHDPLL